MVFPDELGGMKMVRVKDFEKEHPGFGVSITYCFKDCNQVRADIFVYNAGLKKIPTGSGHKLIHSEWQEAQKGIFEHEKRGTYQSVKLLYTSARLLGMDRNAPTALSAEFSFIRDGQPYFSNLYLLGYKNNFIKMRFSYLSKDKKQSEKVLRAFLEGLGNLFEKK